MIYEEAVFKNIVVAVDESDSNLPALDVASQLAVESGAFVTLVNVTVPARMGGGSDQVVEQNKEILKASRIRMERQGAPVGAEANPVAGLRGPPSEITELARSVGADLIIIGSRGHSAWGWDQPSAASASGSCIWHRAPY